MTDEHIDDVVVRAAVVHDADLRSPAIHAAVDAALEALLNDADTLVTHRPDGPGPVAPAYPAERRGRHSGPRRLLTVAAAAVVLAAAVAGLAFNRSDRSNGRTGARRATEPEVATTTTVPPSTTPTTSFPPLPPVEHPPPDPADAPPADAPLAERYEYAVQQAFLANIQHETWLDARGDRSIEFWRDLASGSQRSLLYEPGGGPDGGPAAMDSSSVAEARCSGTQAMSGSDPATPLVERFSGDEISSGELVEDGRETIDGREAIRLVDTGENNAGSVWLDAATLWPLREETPDGQVIHHEFLPRTPENFANLDNGDCL
jgi:hypothetical protein